MLESQGLGFRANMWGHMLQNHKGLSNSKESL